MSFLASTAVHWGHKPDSRSGLHPSDGFEIEAESDVAQQAVMAGTVLV
jgi:hypothetical protein